MSLPTTTAPLLGQSEGAAVEVKLPRRGSTEQSPSITHPTQL